jgi:hypothetical protein
LLAQALEKQYQVDAEGARAVNEAANTLSAEQVEMQVRLALLNIYLKSFVKVLNQWKILMTSRFYK